MLVVPSNTCGACAVGKEGFVKMKRNRVVTLIAGMILTTTLAVSAPLTVFGTDVFDNAGSGDTEFAEDSQFAEPEELPEEDTSWDEQLEGDMAGTDFMDGDPTEGDIPDEDISGEDGSGMELPEEDITDESEDIVEPVIYTVKYDMNGHGDSYTEEVEEGAYAVDWAEPPEEEGYTFLGWFADKKCSTLWDSNAPVSSDVTVYAGWEKIEEEVEEEEVQEEVVEEEAGQEETDQNDSQNTTDNSDEGFTEEENSGSGSATVEEVVEEPAEEEDVSEDAGAAGPTTKKAAEPATDDTAKAATGDTAKSTTEDTAKSTTEDTAKSTTEDTAESATEGPSESATDDTAKEPIDTNSVIKTQPKDVTVAYPNPAEFSVVVNEKLDSESVKYQWYGPDGKAIESETESTLVIDPTKPEDDGKTYYCKLTYKAGEKEQTVDTDKATLHITNKDSVFTTQPKNQAVEYPKGTTFEVATADPDSVQSYQWYLYDKSTKKEIQLDGSTATTQQLYIPSTTKQDDGRSYFCRLTLKGGKKVDSEKAVLKISNKKENKPVLYVGNYAIDPSVDSGKVSTLFLANLDISTKAADDAATDNTFNSITFNGKTNTITFRNVHFSNSNAKYDHKYSPAVGIRLVADQNSQEKYTFEFQGENEIGIANLDSAIDDAAAAFRFDFDNAKKDPEIVFTEKKTDNDPKGTLKTTGGKTAIVCDGDLKIKAEVKVVPESGSTASNGIECENLTLSEGCDLTANACGTAVYVHDTFKMESGAKALLQSRLYKKASKNAVLYAGKELDIEKGSLTVTAGADDSASVSSFSGIECGGDVDISDGSTVLMASKDSEKKSIPGVTTPGNVYGIKTSGKFELEDSHLSVWTKSSDGKGKAFGVLCGSASVSLSKEKVFTVQCVADDGIAFAALTGKSGSTEQGYQDNYTPTKITFETAGVLVPASSKISSGSIKDGSKYDYIETVYNKSATSAPAAGVRFESINHVWGDPVYQWTKDGKMARATRTCKNYPSHTDHMEVETVKTTSKQTKAPTCTEMGQTTYTATFTNKAFKTQTKTIADVKKAGHQFGDWVVTTKPTLTATGIKKRQCKVCKTVESAVVPKLTKGVYKVKKGADLSWNKGSDKSLEIKIVRETENDTAFSHFQGILVDGKVLNKQYYSAKSGSVIIKFKPDFLSKLAIGTHTLTFGFEDGDNPSSKLTIQNSNGSNGSNTSNSTGTTGKGPVTSAKTGDTTNILVWVLTICAAGAAVILIQRYKKNNKDKKDKKSDSSEK